MRSGRTPLRVACFAAELVADQGDVEVRLPGTFGLEPAGLEFDDDVAQLLDVEGQPVDVEVSPLDFEVYLSADERETRAELPEGVDDAVHEGLLEVTLGDFPGAYEELEGGMSCFLVRRRTRSAREQNGDRCCAECEG